MESFQRADNRSLDSIRPVIVTYDVYGYADASVLFEQGNTKVLVGVTLQQTVPPFLKGQRTGWLSAEYAMLPHATHQRTQRESNQAQRNARSVEISRLIGRCLRTVIDLSALGERSITVDCDVLQADGGTRVASITAASIALKIAAARWHAAGIVDKNVFIEQIAAVSTGVVQGVACTDLTYTEDSQADADFNFILTQSGSLIEIQGTCEKKAIAFDLFDQLKQLAQTSIQEIFKQCQTYPLPQMTDCKSTKQSPSTFQMSQSKQPFFSMANRINK